MLAQKRSSPQKVLILTAVLLVAWGVMGWVVYTNFVRVNTEPIPSQWQEDYLRASEQQYPPVPLLPAKHPVFESYQFTTLKKPSVQLPVEAGTVGRDNPFEVIPYFTPSTTATGQ